MRVSLCLASLLVSSLVPACFSPACPLGSPPDAGPDTGALACDVRAHVDPSAVVDLATFRAQASAAVCDWSLVCGWGGDADPFCQPAFASRFGALGAFDLALARTCVAQLASAVDCGGALRVAIDCYTLNRGAGPSNFAGEGVPCGPCVGFGCCSFDLACVDVCTRTVGLGGVCDARRPCSGGASCIAGVCSFPPGAHFGESCSSTQPCAHGLTCRVCLGGPNQCVAVADAPARHHVGCACTTDADCPADVAVCAGGTCTLRPVLGEACSASGPPCLFSRCDATGTCARLDTGEGPCGAATDCASGLVCVVTATAVPASSTTCVPPLGLGQGTCVGDLDCDVGLVCSRASLTCVRPLAVGESCAPPVVGECRASCCIAGTCVVAVPRGESCARCGCTAGLRCDEATVTCL